MLAIGFITIFLLSLGESFNMKKISTFRIKYFATSIIFFIGGVFSFLIFQSQVFLNPDVKDQVNGFLLNKLIYLVVITEMTGLFLSLKNYEINGNNIKAINFSLIFSIFLVPIYAFIGLQFNLFEGNLKINYQNNFEFILFSIITFILSVLFFIDKIHSNQINNIPLLAVYPFVLSLNMYLSSNLIQQYNGYFVYGFIAINLSLLFMWLSIKKREINYINKVSLKNMIPILFIWLAFIPLNVISIKILAVEFITMIKRVCQIISGVILDFYFRSKIKLSKKDIVIIGVIIFLTIGLYIFRS